MYEEPCRGGGHRQGGREQGEGQGRGDGPARGAVREQQPGQEEQHGERYGDGRRRPGERGRPRGGRGEGQGGRDQQRPGPVGEVLQGAAADEPAPGAGGVHGADEVAGGRGQCEADSEGVPCRSTAQPTTAAASRSAA